MLYGFVCWDLAVIFLLLEIDESVTGVLSSQHVPAFAYSENPFVKLCSSQGFDIHVRNYQVIHGEILCLKFGFKESADLQIAAFKSFLTTDLFVFRY